MAVAGAGLALVAPLRWLGMDVKPEKAICKQSRRLSGSLTANRSRAIPMSSRSSLPKALMLIGQPAAAQTGSSARRQRRRCGAGPASRDGRSREIDGVRLHMKGGDRPASWHPADGHGQRRSDPQSWFVASPRQPLPDHSELGAGVLKGGGDLDPEGGEPVSAFVLLLAKTGRGGEAQLGAGLAVPFQVEAEPAGSCGDQEGVPAAS